MRVVSAEPAGCQEVNIHPRSRLRCVFEVFVFLMLLQALGYLVAGTGRLGVCISGSVVVIQHLVAIVCAWTALRRARGNAALFWVLFIATLIILEVPAVIANLGNLLNRGIVAPSTWRVLYFLYGAPIVMMALLPTADRQDRIQPELLLDFIQIVVIVGLVFATIFYLPIQQMLPEQALQRNLTMSNLESVFLLVVVFARTHFTKLRSSRDRLLRLALFVLICAIVTFIGNWIDWHHYVAASAWWDLGWALPIVAAGLGAITWKPSCEPEPHLRAATFFGFLGKNLILVIMLVFIDVLVDKAKQTGAIILADAVVAASLLVFTLRLALTQHYQQREISAREAAQSELTTANAKIAALLKDAQQQTREITQISELGSLLQACASREQAFQIISQRLRRLFPTSSGALSLINASGDRTEGKLQWGPFAPADQSFSPEECWVLQRGCTHCSSVEHSWSRCAHLLGTGVAICIPLIANGRTIGTLALQLDSDRFPESDSACTRNPGQLSERHTHLVSAVGEHIALALANLELREDLVKQAIRDPLTGLYNRRYMQEFLDRELQRARRKHRPLALMMLDLDQFKKLNDNSGHEVGDKTLCIVAEVLLRSIRSEDLACRYGGEEFLVILPECNLAEATARADQIRLRLKDAQVSFGGATPTVTVSIGVAAMGESVDRDHLLLNCADEALYRAKREGRDRVVAAGPIGASIGTANSHPDVMCTKQ